MFFVQDARAGMLCAECELLAERFWCKWLVKMQRFGSAFCLFFEKFLFGNRLIYLVDTNSGSYTTGVLINIHTTGQALQIAVQSPAILLHRLYSGSTKNCKNCSFVQNVCWRARF